MKKILIIGKEPKDFVLPIQEFLRNKNYQVDVIEFRDKMSAEPLGSRFNLNYYAKVDLLKQLYKQSFWKYFFKSLSLRKGLRLSLLSQFFNPIFRAYDIVNFQCMEPLNLDLLRIIPDNQKVICSFWGSDLHTQEAIRLNSLRQFIPKANAITLHSPEMKKTLTSKLPQLSKDLIYFQLFGIKNDFFDTHNQIISDFNKASILKSFGFPSDKLLVMVGYCSKPVANQLLMIQSLDNSSANLYDRVHLVFPSSYGKPSYQKKLKDHLIQTKFSYSLIEEFLSLEKLIQLKLVSDVYLHGNKSDAFSNSMLENIYCNSICLIADWLPYSLLREAGVHYLSFSKFDELPEKVNQIANQFELEKSKLSGNSIRIKDNFGQDAVVLKWYQMIKELDE